MQYTWQLALVLVPVYFKTLGLMLYLLHSAQGTLVKLLMCAYVCWSPPTTTYFICLLYSSVHNYIRLFGSPSLVSPGEKTLCQGN